MTFLLNVSCCQGNLADGTTVIWAFYQPESSQILWHLKTSSFIKTRSQELMKPVSWVPDFEFWKIINFPVPPWRLSLERSFCPENAMFRENFKFGKTKDMVSVRSLQQNMTNTVHSRIKRIDIQCYSKDDGNCAQAAQYNATSQPQHIFQHDAPRSFYGNCRPCYYKHY